jgi:hypothetical protein
MGVRWTRMSWSERNELWTRWRRGGSLRDTAMDCVALQVREDLAHALIAIRRVGLDALVHDRVQPLRNHRVTPSQRRLAARHQPGNAAARRLTAAEEDVVENQPERVDVRASVDALALRLLAMYSTVPTMTPDAVMPKAVRGDVERAIPKSMIRTPPSASISTADEVA